MTTLKGELGQVISDNGSPLQGGGWNKTTAPNSKWAKYLIVGTNSNSLPGIGLLYYDWNKVQTNLDPDLKIALPPNLPLATTGQLFHDEEHIQIRLSRARPASRTVRPTMCPVSAEKEWQRKKKPNVS